MVIFNSYVKLPEGIKTFPWNIPYIHLYPIIPLLLLVYSDLLKRWKVNEARRFSHEAALPWNWPPLRCSVNLARPCDLPLPPYIDYWSSLYYIKIGNCELSLQFIYSNDHCQYMTWFISVAKLERPHPFTMFDGELRVLSSRCEARAAAALARTGRQLGRSGTRSAARWAERQESGM